MDQRVIEEVESMELKGCLGKVSKDECQVSGFVTWANCQTDFNPSPWNWVWGGGSLQDKQRTRRLGRQS